MSRHGWGRRRGFWEAGYGPAPEMAWAGWQRGPRGLEGGDDFDAAPPHRPPWGHLRNRLWRAAWEAARHAEERPYGFGAAEPRGGHGHGHGRGAGGPDFERAWRGFERAFRGFDRGFGPPSFGGPEGPEGPGGPWGRRFGRGDVKYLLLDLLRERPMHGYEMIKELENRHGGRYVPSPGSIYPTLQLLEDRGFVTSNTLDGKRTYTITDAGKAFLDERPDHVKGLWGRPEEWGAGPNFKAAMRLLGPDAWQLGRAFMAAVQAAQGDDARLNSIRAVLVQSREELEALQNTSQRREGGNE